MGGGGGGGWRGVLEREKREWVGEAGGGRRDRMGTEGEAEGGEEEKEEGRRKKRQRGWREGSK